MVGWSKLWMKPSDFARSSLPVRKPGAIVFDQLMAGQGLIQNVQVAEGESVLAPALADIDDDALVIVH
jgi:hypothetical protein